MAIFPVTIALGANPNPATRIRQSSPDVWPCSLRFSIRMNIESYHNHPEPKCAFCGRGLIVLQKTMDEIRQRTESA
jgi:hypothetical protein